jgi:small conductance mechanosensitive channel
VTAPVAASAGSLAAVLDDVTNFSDPAAWWQNLLRLVRQRGSELALNLVAAIAILVVGRWFARVSSKLLGRVATRAKCDTTLAKFASHLSYAAVLALVVLSALHRIGIDTTSFTAVVAAAGLAVGLALQGSLANFAAGVLLIVFKPFKVGDSVLAGGSTGTIEEIQIFSTLIRTDNNAVVIVPNGSITAATITNFSAESTRRIDISLRCSYDNNLTELKRFLLEVLAADDRVMQLPPPVVAIDQLADNGMQIVVQPWVRTEYFPAVRADLLEAIKLGFERHGFRMAGQTKPPLTIRRVAA